MKRIFTLIFLVFAVYSATKAQTLTFNFETGSSVTSPAGGWTNSGVGTFYRSTSTTALTFTDLSATCNDYVKSNQSGSSIIYFQPSGDISAISVSGTGTGANRTFSSIATSTTIGGTYTALAGASGTGTIGAGSATTCGTVAVTNIGNITAGTFIRITFSGNINTTRVDITPSAISPPTTQAINITFPTLAPNSLNVSWTRGNGANVAVFMKAGTGTITNPTDGSVYTASTDFSAPGTQLGTSGYYCIYNGTGTSVGVTNLSPSTNYTVQAFEYNGTGANTKYLTATATNNPNSGTTAAALPTLTVNPTSLAFAGVKTGTVSDKTYSLSGVYLSPAAGDITVTAPAGYTVSTTSGSGYASSITIAYTGSTLAATTIYVRFSPSALTTYNGNITNAGGGATTANVAVTGNGTLYNIGDYMSKASANWGLATTWNKWDGTTWVASSDFPNATTVDVYITGGFTVTDETSARNINNLFISGNSTLKSSSLVNSPVYVKIYGSTVSVESGSQIGTVVSSNNADAISFDVFSTNLTITGGGTVYLSRLRTNTGNSVTTIDNDITLNYHGSANAGNAAAYYIVAGDNNTLTVNAGKTLTFAPWSCFAINSSSHTSGTFALTTNINGTMNFVDGPVPGNATVNGFAGHTNGYMSLGITGKTFNLNIGSAGVLNVSEFYPQGTKADNTAGSGDLVNINVAAGGILNVTQIADFRKATQIVTGSGTYTEASGSRMRIGSADGISASAATGNIQTTTRNYNTGAAYAYEGTAAQTTGDGLPSTVSGLTINNATSVTLTSSITTADSLTLTSGLLTPSANTITVAAPAIIKGGSATSYVNGALVRGTNTAAAYTMPVGKGGQYRPFNIIPATTTASSYTGEYFSTAGNAGTTCNAAQLLAYTKNEYWNVQKNSGSDAQVALNYVAANSNGNWTNDGATTTSDPTSANSLVVAHYTGTCWEGTYSGAATSGSSTSATITTDVMSSFSPFTFGYSAAVALPIHFTSIKAKEVTTGISIGFTNATEKEVLHYEVERSASGSDFVLLTTIPAVNNNGTSATYDVVDRSPLKGAAYYRVKAIDRNGRGYYSAIVKISVAAGGELIVYPNPVRSNLANLQLSNLPAGKYGITITNKVGQQVYFASVSHTGGSLTQSISLEGLNTGIYQIQVSGNNVVLAKQLVKL